MTLRLFSLVLVFAFVLPTARAGNPPDTKPAPALQNKYLLWHLTPADGATPEQTMALEKSIRAHFESTQGKALVDGLTMDALLLVDGNEKFLSCGTGPGCLAGLGLAASTQWVIAGEVRVREGKTRLQLWLVNCSAKVVASQVMMDTQGALTKDQQKELAMAIFEPQRYRGSIELSCEVPGAEVRLDGQKIGVTPLPGPLTEVPAGLHRLEVTKVGHQSFSREVQIPIGQTRTLVALLPELSDLRPAPFYQSWWFWTIGATSVASLGAAIWFHVDAKTFQANADDYKRLSLSDPGNHQEKANSYYLASYIFYGVASAGLIATAVIALVGMMDQPAADAKTGASASSGFYVTPLPGGAGVGAIWRF